MIISGRYYNLSPLGGNRRAFNIGIGVGMTDPKTEVGADWGGVRAGAGRPRLADKDRRVPASIQIPKRLKDEIQREADRDGISFSRAAENRLKK